MNTAFNSVTQPLFRYLIYAFSFIISSCLFPTGFASTTFYLAVLLAFYFFLRKINERSIEWGSILTRSNLIGIIIFLFLGLSILWSQNDIENSIEVWMEYRYFILIPLLSFAFSSASVSKVAVSKYFYGGCIVALVFSYLLAWRIIFLDGAIFSLADSIFHGFLMNIFLAFNLSLFFENKNRKTKFLFLIISAFISYNLLFVEDGRTGILQFFVVIAIYLGYYLGFKALLILFLSFLLLNFFILGDGGFYSTITGAYHDVIASTQGKYNDSSIGQRYEYYSMGLNLIRENFWFGIGIGDTELEFQRFFTQGRVDFLTDNIHSEFLNFFIYSGVFTFCLFVSYFYFLASSSKSYSQKHSERLFFVSAVAVFMVGCVFNSSIKDFGEKHLFCLIFPMLMSARIRN